MSHYAKMKKAACGTSADGREDPRKGEKDIKDSIAQGLDKDKRNFKNGGNAKWHAAKEPHCFRCVHPDCKYAAGETEAYRCDYIGQTGHSRLLWHRVRGLSEEIEECRLYEPGKRRAQTQGINLKAYSGSGKIATTGRLKYPRKAKEKEPKITTKLIRKRELAEARDAERLEMYDQGMTDTQIAAGIAPQGRGKITEERRERREQARGELEAAGLIAAKEE